VALNGEMFTAGEVVWKSALTLGGTLLPTAFASPLDIAPEAAVAV
jgi:hypothetical protein